MGRGLIDIKEIKFYKMCYLMQKIRLIIEMANFGKGGYA